jgi:GntR family transcriptional regulator
MALWIQISPGSNEPVYMQVVSQISQAIAKGQLATGDKLPSVRRLAAELVINPNTVARAYMLLEQTGLVTTKTGSGTFVSDPKLRQHDAADINILTERMDSLITRALNLGLKSDDLVILFQDRVAKFNNQNKKTTGGNENE